MSKINKIKLSGTTYDVEDANASKTVELTQAQYDALVQAGTVDPNTFYIITDAQAVDISEYWTSGQTQSAIDSAVSGKQDTLSAGTGIDITNNVISATGGGGGGKAIEAGRGISVTTGETADTVSFDLPISAGTGVSSIIEGESTSAMSKSDHAEGYKTIASGSTYVAHAEGYQTSAITYSSHAEGRNTLAKGSKSHAEGVSTKAIGDSSHAEGSSTTASGDCSHAEGSYTTASSVSNVSGIDTYMGYQARHAEGSYTLANNASTHTEGYYTVANNFGEHASGVFNNSTSATTTWGDSGNTLFSVGNGTSSARHNAFEIRQNGDIYITSGGTDIKLQDNLGGGGGTITIDPTLDSGSTNAVANSAITTAINAVSGAIPTTTSAVTSGSTAVVESGAVYSQLGGLKLVKLTQTEYDNLGTKDSNTLYVITTS